MLVSSSGKEGSKDSPGIKVVKQRLTRTPTEQQLGTRTVVKRSSIQSEGDPFHVDPVPIPTAQCTDGEQSHNSITRLLIEHPKRRPESFQFSDGNIKDAVTALAEKKLKKAVQHLTLEPEVKEEILTQISNTVDQECQILCSTANPSLLRKCSPLDIVGLTQENIFAEAKEKAPTMMRLLGTITASFTHEQIVPSLSSLLKARNKFMNALAYRNGVLLHQCGLSSRAITIMNKQHVTVSARRIQLFLTELGKGHDESVQNWKDELITHSKMKAMASALEEAVSRHDISGKNFNYELSPADISVNMEPTVDTILFRAAKDTLSTSFLKDAVSGREYATTEATNLNDIPESTFLPTPEDNTLLQTDFAFLWSRVIVNSIPDLESLRTAAVWHIPHPYSEQMQQPSEQVPLGIICRNENKSEEMIAILEEIHNKYLPCLDDDEATKKLFFGGDQLTDERCRSAQRARADGDTTLQKLSGLVPKLEDWHAFRIASQIVIKILRSPASSVDKGTFFANANCVNNSNAKKDALQFYAEVKEFFNMHLDVYITAATLSHWKMDSINEKVVPEEVKNDGCTKVLQLEATRRSHESQVHGIADQHTEESQRQEEEDHKSNYGCATIGLGLLLRNADDAVREGDGARIIQVWKFLMPLFKLHKHNKYALAALRLQADIYSLLPGDLSHELIWNRTVTNRGGKGRHMSRDLRLEHINKVAKQALKAQGAMNISETLAQRAGYAIGKVEKLITNIENDLSLSKPKGYHKSTYCMEDFQTLLTQVFDEADIFTPTRADHSLLFPISVETFCINWMCVHSTVGYNITRKLWSKDQSITLRASSE
ncbi:hypothetical protein BSL78_04918 [Apostichopus japonicus]|uniref:DUF6589 domain-containing protein n=1 Tax=Stichopus japonicus TaxID=307972 RepID=A0A2G8LD62_STIJA|nr:hypothetical protein BSL78_04918 [Apostichopus japonicus]